MNANEYRQKHKRCRYCKYCYYETLPHHLTATTFWKCKVKDKVLDVEFLWNFRGIFCPVFVPEEVEDE